MAGKHIAVIGAGCGGLAALKCCLDEGLAVTCFEKSSGIGGLWNYKDSVQDGQGNIMKTTMANICKEMMAFSDFPPPADFPTFFDGEFYMKYLNLFADKFRLVQHIQFNTAVLKVKQAADYDKTGRWDITVRRNNNESVHTYDGVMVCIGVHGTMKMPTFPGQDKFQGQILHSRDLKDLQAYEGKRVAVVGFGNSAGDCAVELSRIASQVYLLPRHVTWVVPRMMEGGIPLDYLIMRRFGELQIFRKLMTPMMARSLRNLWQAEWYGLETEENLLNTLPMLNDDLHLRIMAGKIKIYRKPTSFSENGVQFEDGCQIDNIDAVVMATGFKVACPFLDKDILNIDDDQVDLYKLCFPPKLKHPTLAMIGFSNIIGPFIPAMELESRWITQVFKGKKTLPSEEVMMEDIEHERQMFRQQYGQDCRFRTVTAYVPHMLQLADLVGCKPNFWRMLLTDPYLAWQCFFGPLLPYQQRLVGPGKWPPARETILTAWDRLIPHNRTSQLAKNKSSEIPWIMLAFISAAVAILCWLLV